MKAIIQPVEILLIKIKKIFEYLKNNEIFQKQSVKRAIEYITYFGIVSIMIFIMSRLYAVLLVSPDDIIYENILSGVATGKPDPHCWFIRFPLTLVISSLYDLIPRFEWYELFLMGCHVLCYFLILCRARFLKNYKKGSYILFSVLIIWLLCIEYTVHLEWSTTAGILGATAIYRFVTIPLKRTWKSDLVEYGICLGLLLLGFCLRNTVIYMFIPLAILCWLKRAYDIEHKCTKKKIRRQKQIAMIDFVVISILSVLLIMLLHSLAYSDDSWKAYKEYTNERANLVDYYGYPSYDDYESEYEEAGISVAMYNLIVNDYNYLVAFDQADSVDFSELSAIAKENNNEKSSYDKFVAAYEKIENLLTEARFLIPGSIVVLCFIFLLFKLGKVKKSEMIYYVGIVLWLLAMIIYIAAKGKLPIRVGICIVMAFCAAVLGEVLKYYASNADKAIVKNKYQKICLSVIALCIFLLNVFDISLDNKKNADLAVAKNQIVQYCSANPQNVYLRDFNSFSQRGNLFCISEHASNYINTGGWSYNTEIYEEILELNGIDGVTNSIKNGKKIFYLVNESRLNREINRLNRYFDSIQENIVVQESDRFETVNEVVVVLEFIYTR